MVVVATLSHDITIHARQVVDMASSIGRVRFQVLALVAAAGCGTQQLAASEDEANLERSPKQPPGGKSAMLVERAKLAASGRYLASRRAGHEANSAGLTANAATTFSDALDLPGDQVIGTTLTGPAEAAQIRANLGIIQPIQGASFVLLSTGIAGTATPEPGIDLGLPGAADDVVTLRLDLQVPVGANRLSLQYNFLSAESPDFVGTIFNDTFSLQLVEPAGTRAFTLASVNSSQFFDASDSRANDSGFDLFADDPAGVDTVFGVGLPDAGLTDFQSFDVEVTGGGNLQLVLAIQDNGDGILDSAVLLDSIRFSALELVDPNPDLVIADGGLTPDLDALVTGGQHVRGAIADGATDVLLRVNVPGPGSVTFSVEGATAPANGLVSTLAGNELQGAVTTRTVVVGGTSYALAVYRSPADFNRGGDEALIERTIQLRAAFVPDTGAGFDTLVDFQITRPPVVVVHGLWSTTLDWLKFPMVRDPRFAITYAPHAYYCDDELRVAGEQSLLSLSCPLDITTDADSTVLCEHQRANAIGTAVREALANTRRLGNAATQVDLVAHGAGGIHARAYINAPGYQNVTNLNRGDVNRLITLNTPHFGSEVADKIVAAREISTGAARDAFLCTARVRFSPSEPGEIDVLTRSNAALQRTAVPAHAVIGTGGNALDRSTSLAKLFNRSSLYISVETKLRPFKFFPLPPRPSSPSEAFGALDHDLFVNVVSQQGGLPEAAVSRFAATSILPDADNVDTYFESDQFHSLQDPEISTRVAELLDLAVGGPAFAEFPAAPAFAPGFAAATATASASLLDEGSVRIVSPAAGAEVIAGELVTVDVVGEGGFALATVLAVANGSVATSTTPPFTTQVRIPSDSLGPIRVFVLGLDAAGEAVVSEEVVVNVRTNATLEAVQIVTQDPILFGVGARRQLVSVGKYSDGFTRDITASLFGTVYRTSNAGVVTVSSEGTIIAVGRGIATVTSQNGNTQDSVTVTVQGNSAPFARAGDDVSLACVAPGATVPVQLDGLASFDADADPLTLTWLEGGTELASGATPTISLGAGAHVIDLVVTDGLASAQDAMSVAILEDSEAPSLSVLGTAPAALECGQAYADEGATATDTCDGDLTAAVVAETNVNPQVAGTYAVDYRVRDQAGLIATASRPVVVADHAPPQLSILGANPATAECRTEYRDDGAAATDVCDGTITASIVAQSNVNTSVLGSYGVDYEVRDLAGFTATARRPVVVADRTPPAVTIRPTTVLDPFALFYRVFNLSDCAQAADACTGAVNIDQLGRIVAIHSDEPDRSWILDPGNDIVILGTSTFALRRESDLLRNGRVYEIEFTVRDSLGNTSAPRSCFVGVKTSLFGATPINDGRVFTVRP
jgi:hypothetical protein